MRSPRPMPPRVRTDRTTRARPHGPRQCCGPRTLELATRRTRRGRSSLRRTRLGVAALLGRTRQRRPRAGVGCGIRP
jgi:hypothetical protein